MKLSLKDVFIVWKYEWFDLYRSRLAIFWLSLYLLGALSSSLFFIMVIGGIENKIAQETNLSETKKAGAMTSSLQESRQFREIVTQLVGDAELARQFMTAPLIALFFGWMSLTFAPFLVILLSSESVSSDISSGAARFSLFRTSRLAYVLGKGASQATLVLAGIVLSALITWLVGMFRLSSFKAESAAWYLLIYSLRSWIYTLPFLGLGLAVSQVIKSVQLSRAVGIVIFFATVIFYRIADQFSAEGFARIWELLIIVLPQGHRLDFWRPDLMSQVSAVSFSLGLAFLYFMAGYYLFSRKDI